MAWAWPGLPLVSAPSLNGTAVKSPSGILTMLQGSERMPADTESAASGVPETVAVTTFQIAALAASLVANTATSTAGTATMNKTAGLITTEPLTTDAGASYTFTLVNSLIPAGSPTPTVALYNGTNTGGSMALTSVANGAGSSVFVFTNVGSTALNGTVLIAFHV